MLTGAALDRIDIVELSCHVEETTVFARAAPEHNVKIVHALKVRGHAVNDAPALKNADIGIAMTSPVPR